MMSFKTIHIEGMAVSPKLFEKRAKAYLSKRKKGTICVIVSYNGHATYIKDKKIRLMTEKEIKSYNDSVDARELGC